VAALADVEMLVGHKEHGEGHRESQRKGSENLCEKKMVTENTEKFTEMHGK